MLIVSLFMSGVTYPYYSPVRFVNESNTRRSLFLIPAAVCRLTFIILTWKGKHFSSSHSEIRLPWCHVMQIFHPYHPCLVSWYRFYIEWREWSHEKRGKKKSLKRNTTYIFIRRLSSFIPGCLIHVGLLSLSTCHLAAPALSYSHPFFFAFISLFRSVLVSLLSD